MRLAATDQNQCPLYRWGEVRASGGVAFTDYEQLARQFIAAGERGKKAMPVQRFEILTATAAGGRVVLELAWTGTLAVPLGSLPVGGEMRAWFAFVTEFRDGKVWRKRNYDCFDPW